MRALRVIAKQVLSSSPGGFSRLFAESCFEDLVPEFLWLEVTDQCASRCKSCDIWQRTPSPDLLTPDEVENALRDPVFSRLKIVVVSGGEPTLRHDLEAILASVHRALPKVRIVLSSNGMHPERLLSAVRSALGLGVSLEVGVSVDGIASAHDRSRGVPGLFERVDYSLGELMKLKRIFGRMLRVTVSFTLSDATLDQTELVRKYAEDLGATFNVQWYNEAAYYGNTGRDLLSARNELVTAARKLRPTLLNAVGMRVVGGGPMEFSCTSMFNFCLLKCNGDIVPCFGLWNSTVGNIRDTTASAIWRGGEARLARCRVRNCSGCLNTCGVLWSYDANYAGRIRFYLRHPNALSDKLRAVY